MRFIGCFFFACSFCALHAGTIQTHSVFGQIIDLQTQESIPFIHVFLQDTEFGTISDQDGKFYLTQVPEGAFILVIQGEGYGTIKEHITVSSSLNKSIVLSENVLGLPQLVVESHSISAGKVGLIDIPGSVQRISSKELTRHNYSNVNDVLRMIPGVNIQEEDGFGLRPNIGLRGSGLERSSKITIMEDGVLAAPAPYAAPSAYYFPTFGRMNSVEVLKGSSQIRFGPFTTGGAINFISTPIPKNFNAFLKGTGGNYGYNDFHAHIGTSFDRIGFVVETFQYGADGFKELPSNTSTGFKKQDHQFKIRFSTLPDANIFQSIGIKGGYTSEDSNETYLGLTHSDFKNQPYSRYPASQKDNMLANQQRLAVEHYIELSEWIKVVTTLYRNDFERNWYKLQSVLGSGSSIARILGDPYAHAYEYSILSSGTDSDSASLKLRANSRKYISQGLQSVMDIEFETGIINHNIQLSSRFHQDEEDRFQWEDLYSIEKGNMNLVNKGEPGSQANRIERANAHSGYVFYQLRYKNLSFSPGIRFENLKISREDFGGQDLDRKGTELTKRQNEIMVWLPGIGFHYQLEKGLSLFSGIHKGFAPPGSKTGARPEENLNYEVGLRSTNNKVKGSITLYYSDYKNLLGRDVASSGGTGSGNSFNAGTAVTRGVELQLQSSKTLGTKFLIPYSISYTLTDAYFTKGFESEFEGWGDVEVNDKLPYIPLHQLYTSVGLRSKRFETYLSTRFQSKVNAVAGQHANEPEQQLKSYLIVDWSSNFKLSNSISINVSTHNLLNNEYAVANRPAGLRPGMPRSLRAGIRLIF